MGLIFLHLYPFSRASSDVPGMSLQRHRFHPSSSPILIQIRFWRPLIPTLGQQPVPFPSFLQQTFLYYIHPSICLSDSRRMSGFHPGVICLCGSFPGIGPHICAWICRPSYSHSLIYICPSDKGILWHHQAGCYQGSYL